METVLGVLAVIFLLAFLAETMTEYLFGTPFDKIPVLTPYKWALMYVAAIVGLVMAFVYQFDLVHILGGYVGLSIPVHWLGIGLTGLAIGRGSNYLHDLVSKFFTKPQPPAV